MTQRQFNGLGIDAAGVACAVAISALVYFAGIAPAQEAMRAAEAERVELAQRKSEADSLEKSLRTAASKFDELSKTDLNAPKVGGGTALDRIGRISELAANVGVSVTDLSPKPEQPGARFNRIPITISGHGPAPAFQTLLSRLHAEFPDTQVASVTITSTPEAAQSPAAFSAELVWYTVAKVAGQADKAAGTVNAGSAGAAAPATR